MNDPRDERLDEQLRGLLADAVSDVEPSDSLDSLHHRTKVTSMNSRRPWLFAVGGAVVATAAVITAIALAGGGLAGRDTAEPTPAPATQSNEPSPSEPSPTQPSETSEPSQTAAPAVDIPVYYAGETPDGTRLYREFQVGGADDLLQVATSAAVSGTPVDPDYRTLWPGGTAVEDATWDGDVARVDLSGAPADRPAGMTEEEARLAIQQVVFTAQAAVGEGRIPVQLTVGGQPTAQVLGQPTSEPLANDSVLATLAHVSLTSPEEGRTYVQDRLVVSGVANSFEANVVVRIQRWEGTEVMDQRPLTAEGYMEDKLFPFRGEFDISAYPPGDYIVMAMTDDPSGNGMSHTDTKRFTVQ
jgi:hypothetical protein